jgi:hypothetical protein
MITKGAVPGFTPGTNGFRFTNSFPPDPTIRINLGPAGTVGLGNASNGVCGGMAYAVRDYFEATQAIPSDTTPPAATTPLYTFICHRLIDSFDLPGGAIEYAHWMLLPSADLHLIVASRAGTFSRTVRTSWPQVRADIDSGHPSPLGLVTVHTADLTKIGKCHQVLAYAYELDDAGPVRLSIYDPNTAHAAADEVWIRFDGHDANTVSAITHNINIAEPTLHGFFRSAYSPKTPPIS